MTKYIYIQCFERDIHIPQIFDTFEQALSAMHKDFIDIIGEDEINCVLENQGVDLRNINECLLLEYDKSNYAFDNDFLAYANTNNGNWDARICTITI